MISVKLRQMDEFEIVTVQLLRMQEEVPSLVQLNCKAANQMECSTGLSGTGEENAG
jgi:hypothetical protein